MAKNYFRLVIVLLLFVFVCCNNEPHPAYLIISNQEEFKKVFFSETGDTLLSADLDADSVFSGRYLLWLNDSDKRVEAIIDSNQLNGDYFVRSKGGDVLKEGSFINGEKHLRWRFFEEADDSVRLKNEKNFFLGQPFGLRIDYKRDIEQFDFFLINGGEKMGWGSFIDNRYSVKGGSLNFYEYVQIGNSSRNPDLVLFVADIPGLEVEISILDKDQDEIKMRQLSPDGWMNGMWYFEGWSIKAMTSLTVKTIDVKLLDGLQRDVYRDFIILPVVF